MLRNTIFAALGLLLILTLTQEPAKQTILASRQAEQQVAKTEPTDVTAVSSTVATQAVVPPTAGAAQPVVAKPPTWAVQYSPVAGVSIDTVNAALAHFQAMGMSRQGAAYLTGNFLSESHLDPCGTPGDGGQALGFGQWHPNRRYDMPCDFYAQLDWAVNVEMVRDTPALRDVLFDPSADVYTIMVYLQKWERWGTLGGRWTYAQVIISQI